MKFSAFKEYKGNLLEAGATTSELVVDVVRYLSIDLVKALRELTGGLTKLSFLDNFQSFTVDVTIAATSELPIRNELKGGMIPTQRIIVRGGTGAASIVDGDNTWTAEYVYLKNPTASSITATVLFLK